jgi:FkbH-like protein
VGRNHWFDDRYWHVAKQAVALDALPLLARHTIAVLAASLGMSRKCLVLDLDGTLWGGVIGEDGLGGITLGGGPAGESYVAFQEYLLQLKGKGVILAVASKNNEEDARLPFEQHPDMRIKLDDISAFVANWEDKPANLRAIARSLNIGLDALVLVDDNPAERQLVRQELPEVDVVVLPREPSRYVRVLAEHVRLETVSLTEEDRQRTEQYRARAQVDQLAKSATNLDDFYLGLKMEALVAPFDDVTLPRLAQLIGKTNQFNTTSRRYSIAQLQGFMADPDCVHCCLRLRDRFADHGLVSVLIAWRRDETLEIDTLLMSCRVIGRTVEAQMLKHLCSEAQQLGCTQIRGSYVPTDKNALVRELYSRFGFSLIGAENGMTTWEYNLALLGPIENRFISEWNDAAHD